jgi:glutamate synthase (NADPH/NADH) large chain
VRRITNSDRAFGADIAGAIAARYGDDGLPEGSVEIAVAGSAGQSFGAFAVPGMRLLLVGDANDGVGKGMHGGEIAVAPAARERGRSRQVLVGNAALYGATGGRLFVAGVAGERFAVRNSGATAVVEGVGDHACEYMTGGVVVLLGASGRNFGAGMTGGAVYLRQPDATFVDSMDEALRVETMTAADVAVLKELLKRHVRLTGSRIARAILRDEHALATFRRVAPAHACSAEAAGDGGRTVDATAPHDVAVNE